LLHTHLLTYLEDRYIATISIIVKSVSISKGLAYNKPVIISAHQHHTG